MCSLSEWGRGVSENALIMSLWCSLDSHFLHMSLTHTRAQVQTQILLCKCVRLCPVSCIVQDEEMYATLTMWPHYRQFYYGSRKHGVKIVPQHKQMKWYFHSHWTFQIISLYIYLHSPLKTRKKSPKFFSTKEEGKGEVCNTTIRQYKSTGKCCNAERCSNK